MKRKKKRKEKKNEKKRKEKKAMWFIPDPWQQTSHSTPFVFLEVATNISLLENRIAKLVSTSVPDWNTQETCMSPEPWSELPKLRGYLRGKSRELRLGELRGKSWKIHCGWEQQHPTPAQNRNGNEFRVINSPSLPGTNGDSWHVSFQFGKSQENQASWSPYWSSPP